MIHLYTFHSHPFSPLEHLYAKVLLFALEFPATVLITIITCDFQQDIVFIQFLITIAFPRGNFTFKPVYDYAPNGSWYIIIKKICALRKKGHEITERTIFTPFKIAYTAITTGSRRLGFNCEDVVM